MEASDENFSHHEEEEAEDSLNIKIPHAKIRYKSNDRSQSESPLCKIMIRHSSDSPSNQQSNYEIITKSRKGRDDSAAQLSPTVHIERYEVPSTDSTHNKAIKNGLDLGLDPIGIMLISSMTSSKAGSEYSDKSEEHHSSMKINREMKNLQKSTNDSKILAEYLSSSSESSRSRNRKNKDLPLADPDEHDEESRETVIKGSPASHQDGNETDTTELLLPMEPPERRRKSVARSRNRSQSAVRGRNKSVARQMKDELSVTSDKDEAQEEEDDDQMSENSALVSRRSIESRPVHPPPKLGWDSFCFKCHTDNPVLSLACSKCKCSYHRHCVRTNPIPKNADEFECPECREVETAKLSVFNKYGHEKIDANTLAEMLTIILEKIRTYPDRESFENDIIVKGVKDSSTPLIVTQMSLKTLDFRIKTHFYKVTEAFIHDIKQLEHNWNIVDRSKTKTLKTIVKYVNTEINELEACVYCYQNSFITGDWFVQPCKRPHLLIWAKLKGYPYWPAKVMSIDSRQHVDVRFFGAHDRAWVPTMQCILFCEKDPNKTKGSTPTSKTTNKTQKGIADAMKEKDDYIVKLREKYGFKYAPFKQKLEANDLQSHLEFMLPELKRSKDAREGHIGGSEKELDGAQKEKLTLKIIKGQSSNYKVEHKTTEQRLPQSHKDKPKLYKVLSKNDDNADMEQSGKLQPLIIKRKSNVEQENDKSKKSKNNNEAAPETSDTNASVQSGVSASSRRKSTRGPAKHKKPNNAEKESFSEPPVKKARRHSEKQKPAKEDSGPETEVIVEKSKTSRKSRAKSVLPECGKPLLVPRLVPLVVPPGTDEIEQLKTASPTLPPIDKRVPKRNQQRSRSFEKESTKEPKNPLRTVNNNDNAAHPIKRSLSEMLSKKSVAEDLPQQQPVPTQEQPAQETGFDPNIVIKDEPVSENEQEEETENAYTLSDIPNLIRREKSGKKKVIVISTNDGGETSSSVASSQQSGRARKTFPNQPSQLQQIESLTQQQNRSGDNWMICIPQVFPPAAIQTSNMQSPPTSSRSTPSDSQVSLSQLRNNNSSIRNSLSSQQSTNRSANANTVPPLNYSLSNNSSRRNSINSNPVLVNGQRTALQSSNVLQQRTQNQETLPRLVPKPQGVFLNDGSTFIPDVGPVSRMFTDNAHRMSDFFRNVLLETLSSFASEVPAAENLMLRAENEKLQREKQLIKSECQQKMQDVKSDCQMKMQELRREHQDEIETLKKEFDERQKRVQMNFDQEKMKMIHEIRQQCEIDKQRAIEITRKETKKNTWCSNCPKEARFYCCWNTSYCGPQCQKTHWQIHQKGCSNKNSAIETSTVQQTVAKPVNPEPVVLNMNPNRQALVLRGPQQMQQLTVIPAQQSHPVSIQQHIILTTASTSAVTPGMNSNMPKQQILIGSYQNKNRAITSIYHDQATRDALTSAINVKTNQRNDSPNLNVISTLPMTESMMSTSVQE